MSTFDKVKDVIIDKLGVEEDSIKSEAHFVNDLGADSLDTVELIMEFRSLHDIIQQKEKLSKRAKNHSNAVQNQHKLTGDNLDTIQCRALHKRKTAHAEM